MLFITNTFAKTNVELKKRAVVRICNHHELVRHIATALGKKPRLLPVPTTLLQLAGKLTGKTTQIERLLGSLAIDSSKIRNDLGWQPVCSMQEELVNMAKAIRK